MYIYIYIVPITIPGTLANNFYDITTITAIAAAREDVHKCVRVTIVCNIFSSDNYSKSFIILATTFANLYYYYYCCCSTDKHTHTHTLSNVMHCKERITLNVSLFFCLISI